MIMEIPLVFDHVQINTVVVNTGTEAGGQCRGRPYLYSGVVKPAAAVTKPELYLTTVLLQRGLPPASMQPY